MKPTFEVNKTNVANEADLDVLLRSLAVDCWYELYVDPTTVAEYLAERRGGTAAEWKAILEVDRDPLVKGAQVLPTYAGPNGRTYYRATEVGRHLGGDIANPEVAVHDMSRFIFGDDEVPADDVCPRCGAQGETNDKAP